MCIDIHISEALYVGYMPLPRVWFTRAESTWGYKLFLAIILLHFGGTCCFTPHPIGHTYQHLEQCGTDTRGPFKGALTQILEHTRPLSSGHRNPWKVFPPPKGLLTWENAGIKTSEWLVMFYSDWGLLVEIPVFRRPLSCSSSRHPPTKL